MKNEELMLKTADGGFLLFIYSLFFIIYSLNPNYADVI